MLRIRRTDQAGMTLIELLVAMSISMVIMAMLLLSWFALQSSYARSTKSAEQREIARDAVARMTRELRDMQGNADQGALKVAQPDTVSFYTPFNDTKGNNYLTRYTSANGKVIRYRDDNNNGVFGAKERQIVIASNVVNTSATPVFSYTYIDNTGVHKASSITNPNAVKLVNIEIHIMIDLNPGKSPTHMDLVSTAQPRNLRLL